MSSRLALVGFAALSLSAVACGVDTSLIFDTGTSDGGSGGSSTTTVTVGEGGASTSVGVVNTVGTGGTPSTGGAGAGGDDPMCLPEEVVAAELGRLDMLILFDRTGSTGQFLGQEKVEVQTFAQSEAAPGTRLSLLYHGAVNSCDPMNYPAALPMTPIPSQAQDIVNSLAPIQANGGSPWLPPIESGIDFTTSVKTQNPDHNVVMVMIADSQQSFCGANIQQQIVPVVAGGLMAGVTTYVIGINQAPIGQLSIIAQAGGTPTAIDLTGNQLGDLSDELSDIRSEEIPCSIELPTPSTGKFNPEDVAFRYGSEGGAPTDVMRVTDANNCVFDGEGWFFDDPNNPTSIGLCRGTCEDIKEDPSPVLQVAFTCPIDE